MTRLDWSRANFHSHDPGRVADVPNDAIPPDGYTHRFSRLALTEYARRRKVRPKSIRDRIAVIGCTGGVDANGFIHDTAVMILERAKKHRDTSDAARLIRAMPASYRRSLLIAWFGAFAPISISKKTGKARLRKLEEKAYREFDLAAANQTPFYKLEFRGRGTLRIPSAPTK